MPIGLIQGAAFDAEITKLLGHAYERASQGLPPDDVKVREVIAKRIIKAARRGERDLDKLIACGLGKN
jgi:hypothetical protein